jgi:glucose/arabinose dehydrogenase
MVGFGCVLALSGCLFKGGGQVDPKPAEGFVPDDVALPTGYRIEEVASHLTFPVGVTFDQAGNPYVIESGYSYGEVVTTPQLLQVLEQGKTKVVARGNNPPWLGVTFAGDRFYVTAGGHDKEAGITVIEKDGSMRELVGGLPSMGDHQTNSPVIGPDGALYFGQGTATNSGVVGPDNAMMGWLKNFPQFHDIPCEDVELKGENFPSDNPLSQGAKVTTGAYLPFGTPSTPGQVIKGQVPCTGAVFRVPLQGDKPAIELYAWGLRNPFGLAFDDQGQLYVADNGMDERGSRSVFGAGDLLIKIEKGGWYGWPDFSGGRPVESRRFDPPLEGKPKMLLAKHPADPPPAAAYFAVHSSSDGLDFSKSDSFGYRGDAFVAQFGDMAPQVGKIFAPVGFKVVRVDPRTGVISDFAVNKGDRNGPASYQATGGLERPIAARFSPDGKALYVVDFGVMSMTKDGPKPWQESGRLLRIVKEVTP